MLDTLSSTSLLVAMEIIGPMVLAAVLIYASVKWSRRRKASVAVSETATRGLYRQADRQERREEASASGALSTMGPELDEVPPNPRLRGKLRSGREGSRPSEDDLAREHLSARRDATRSRNCSTNESFKSRSILIPAIRLSKGLDCDARKVGPAFQDALSLQ
jgi:hypothetical protein